MLVAQQPCGVAGGQPSQPRRCRQRGSPGIWLRTCRRPVGGQMRGHRAARDVAQSGQVVGGDLNFSNRGSIGGHVDARAGERARETLGRVACCGGRCARHSRDEVGRLVAHDRSEGMGGAERPTGLRGQWLPPCRAASGGAPLVSAVDRHGAVLDRHGLHHVAGVADHVAVIRVEPLVSDVEVVALALVDGCDV